jgi:hypothetical protein
MSIYERESKKGSIPPFYIDIKKSTIPGSGDGVFAACDIPKGVTIGEYLGKIYKGSAMDRATGDYLFYVSGAEPKIIDGKTKKHSSWVRYVNSPQTWEAGNAYFYQYDGRIFIKTKKNIPAGQEIFAYYGDGYIDDKLRQYFSKKTKPKISEKMKGIKCMHT